MCLCCQQPCSQGWKKWSSPLLEVLCPSRFPEDPACRQTAAPISTMAPTITPREAHTHGLGSSGDSNHSLDVPQTGLFTRKSRACQAATVTGKKGGGGGGENGTTQRLLLSTRRPRCPHIHDMHQKFCVRAGDLAQTQL